jgi:hypothetical protein
LFDRSEAMIGDIPMDTPKSFSEIWKEAHRGRSEVVWSIITRLMASPRRQAPRTQTDSDIDNGQPTEVDAVVPTTVP